MIEVSFYMEIYETKRLVLKVLDKSSAESVLDYYLRKLDRRIGNSISARVYADL